MAERVCLNSNGILVKNTRLQAFTVSQANLDPPKRIARIQELLNTKEPRVCVLRGEGIGDVIMTTPTVHALYEQFNGRLKITYATNTKYLDGALVKTLAYNPEITNVIDRDTLNEADYDVVVNLHCPAILHEKPMAPPINRIDLFARHAGFNQLKDTRPKYFLQPKEAEQAALFFQKTCPPSAKRIMVNMISSSPTRSLSSKAIYEALEELSKKGYVLLIVSHTTDHTSSSEINSLSNTVSLKDKDIRELAAIMAQSDLVLCPDSALLHLAGALNVPTVALFGPTDPRARVNYYPKAKAIWGGEGMPGHPHWYEKCPYGDLCWKKITKEDIVNTCIAQLECSGAQSIVSTDLV